MKKPLFIAEQSSNPRGWFGKIVAKIMARETAGENDAAIDFMSMAPRDRILDFGCGHGQSFRRISRIASQSQLIAGVDQSEVMVTEARRRNQDLIQNGLLKMEKVDSASKLPFDDSSFDKILSVHTIYFISPLRSLLTEFRRVLAPGGQLVLAFHGNKSSTLAASLPSEVYNIRSTQDVSKQLEAAGMKIVGTELYNKDSHAITLLKAEASLVPEK